MSELRVHLYGKNKAELLPVLGRLGVRLVEERPDVVVSYGGDGTLLATEHLWPGVPKVALRDSRRCHTCSHESNEVILRHLIEGTLKRTEFLKIRAAGPGWELTCINDVILRNASLNAGVRCRVWIDEEPYADEIVGDGLVVSTPFGSTAYYRSITHSTFRVGIGLAFNNSTEPINHLVLDDRSRIRVLVTRGPALLGADNHPRNFHLERGDEITIQRADACAVILAYDRVKYPADQFIFYEPKTSEVGAERHE